MGGVIVGTDSFIGNTTSRCIIDRPKWHQSGGVTMLFAGSLRVPQILASDITFPRADALTDGEVSEMIHESISSIRKVLEDGGAVTKDENGDIQASEIVFAVSGRVYCMQSDFAVIRYACGYHATGSGGDYALGALYAMGAAKRKTEAGVTLALKTAVELSPYVCGPLHVRTV